MFCRVAILIRLAGVLMLSSIAGSAWGTVRYAVTDLGTLGGSASEAWDINASGQVAGGALTLSESHAFLYSNGTMADLDTFSGSSGSWAWGISAIGQVVGEAYAANDSRHAFVYQNGMMADLGTLGGMSSSADGINAGGQVVGWANTSSGDTHAFLDSNGTMADLGTFPGFSGSVAYGINAVGQVIGAAYPSGGVEHAFLYANGTMVDLGTLGGSGSRALGINAGGQVAGFAYTTNNDQHAFLDTNGTMADLGTLGGLWSSGCGINDSGQVVGYAYTSSGMEHAFLYTNGTMADLNSLVDLASGWVLEEADAINDSGQIVGSGTNASGEHRAFLLTPVPEPSAATILLAGAVCLLAVAWRRARRLLGVAFILTLAASFAQADVFNMGGTRDPVTGTWTGQASLEFVTVGDPGNAVDRDVGGGYGSVGYTYQIGKYDVTAAQYCQFLNAVAKSDPYGLYDPGMANPSSLGPAYVGCGIAQTGASGNYTYQVTSNPNFPVNYISWASAVRLCNWLENKQPAGPQGPGTTETGAYTLNGATTLNDLAAVTRNVGARYCIPTRDEWFKAAYYKGGRTDAGYWMYPTRSNDLPSNVLSATGTNNANCCIINWTVEYPTFFYTDPVNFLTPVGAFAASPGAYGTYDMGGDVFQWTEDRGEDLPSPFPPSPHLYRGTSGGDFGGSSMAAFNGYWSDPTLRAINTGFRIARALLPGDANGDGTVDIIDLTAVLSNFDKSGMIWNQGDFDGNGAVDIGDLGKVLANFDKTLGASVGIGAVPEPSAAAILLAGAVCLVAAAWRRARRLLGVAFILTLAASLARADVFNMGGTRDTATGTWTGQASLEFATVGDPGNAGEQSGLPYDTTYYGSVGYVYRMGKYDVTLGQYVQFLNAVAKTDTYGLYKSSMATDLPTIGITRSGGSGSYNYSVTGSYSQGANCPIFDVTWGDAARFCNWLQNGQPTGAQDLSTTEDGAYYLNGAWTIDALMAVTRKAGATWAIPTEDEWYKAAYYQGGSANAYWGYPTRSNTVPGNTLPDTGNSANLFDWNGSQLTYSDPTNLLTPVGAFSMSPGPYGTYDMGGDVHQWNEASIGFARGLRGGDWGQYSFVLASSSRFGDNPTFEGDKVGFRVASIALPGDANSDGIVDIADLSVALTNFDKTGMTWSQGDFNADGTVNMADLSSLLTNFDKTLGAPVGIGAVPEPSAAALLLVGAACLLARRRK